MKDTHKKPLGSEQKAVYKAIANEDHVLHDAYRSLSDAAMAVAELKDKLYRKMEAENLFDKDCRHSINRVINYICDTSEAERLGKLEESNVERVIYDRSS